MKLPLLLPRSRTIKFIPTTIITLFVLANLTGVFFIHALAPIVTAHEAEDVIPADIPTSGDIKLDHIIFDAGKELGVDPRFIHAVIWQESKYDAHARSHAGAEGLMQLMPDTAKRFGCSDPADEEANVIAGTKYLSWLLKRFDGNVELTLAGYNAGEGAVDKYNGIPPFSETRNYVKIISSRYGHTFHPVLSPEAAAHEFHLDSNASVATSVE